MIISSARRALPWLVALAAGAGGAIVALHYHRLGLTLSHYDARGHLVVARRILDSITPGWQQIGAVWLPLPHLLNALPVSFDPFYRNGAVAVAISVAAFAAAAGSIAAVVLTLTESPGAAIAAAAVFALNPNVLYLQSTPMTEPLLLALTTLAIAMVTRWVQGSTRLESFDSSLILSLSKDERLAQDVPVEGRAVSARGSTVRQAHGRPQQRRRTTSSPRAYSGTLGFVFALACLTRYEAWPVTACALGAAVFARWRLGDSPRAAIREVSRIAVYPALAIVGFVIFSRIVIGEWLVPRGFFVPENKALGDPLIAAKEIVWGVRMSSGPVLLALGSAGTVLLVAIALASRRRAFALIPVSLVAMAAIPWTAFLDGHPYRMRYVIPLTAMEAIGAGALAGALGRARLLGAILLFMATAYELRPLDAAAPMVAEAQWDRINTPVRARVTACLGPPGSGDKIMASMGSLGHYMQEASNAGFSIRDFLHEGNGDIWLAALESPYPFAEWVLLEEKAEGGDMLAILARERPTFLDGYTRVCDGAGLALYRRRDQG